MGVLDDKNRLINKADELFEQGLDGVDVELAREIIKIYASFVVDGQLVLKAEEIARLEEDIIAAISKTKYRGLLSSYLPNLEAIEDMNKLIQKEVNDIDINAIINENEKIFNHKSVLESRLRGTPSTVIKIVDDGVERLVPIRNSSLNELINPIADVIRRDVISGVSFKSATESTLNAIKKKELGLSQWAGQIAKDALKQSDGIINQQVKEKYNMKYGRYIGSIKDTTRPICYHLLQKSDPVYSDDEIQEVLAEYQPNGIPSSSTTTKTPTGKSEKKGSGIIPGTTAENFSVRRGGYNCGHDFVPLIKKKDAEKVDNL